MQLIAIFLFCVSAMILCGTVLFVAWWHHHYRKSSFVQTLREDIAHIGVSGVIAYPKTVAPLVALLEEEYPRSEAVVVVDLQENATPFGELIERYHLVKVNHSHLDGVRALYRSRHRAYRRVVVVDLPAEYRQRAFAIGRSVASYDNILYLQGESIVERDTLTYCANVAASQPSSAAILLRSIVGTEAYFERGNVATRTRLVRLRAEHPLAWRKSSMFFILGVLLLLSAMLSITLLTEGWIVLISAILTMLMIVVFSYAALSVKSQKSLLARLDTVLQNCYNFIVGKSIIPQESKILDTPLSPSRERVRNRPEWNREDALPKRSHPSRPKP